MQSSEDQFLIFFGLAYGIMVHRQFFFSSFREKLFRYLIADTFPNASSRATQLFVYIFFFYFEECRKPFYRLDLLKALKMPPPIKKRLENGFYLFKFLLLNRILGKAS